MENITLVQPNTTHQFLVSDSQAGQRLDQYLKKVFPSYSRNFLQQLITQNLVQVNNKKQVKPRTVVKNQDQITITFPPQECERPRMEIPKDLKVEIVHEDQHFFVINKPNNLAVHPPKITHQDVTLIDWLTHKFQELSRVGYADRPGIVHRLDKDTSGILLVARNNCAHALLCDLFRKREIQKTYLALVSGHPDKEGTIDFAIMRHQTKRNTMTHVLPGPVQSGPKRRDACTHYKVLEYFKDASLIEAKPVTGRTHQIRVHFAAIGHPIIGDYVYGKKSKTMPRQALHAQKLSFKFNGKQYNFCQNPPEDFLKNIEILRNK